MDYPLFSTDPPKTSTKTSKNIRADGRSATLIFVQNWMFDFCSLNFSLIHYRAKGGFSYVTDSRQLSHSQKWEPALFLGWGSLTGQTWKEVKKRFKFYMWKASTPKRKTLASNCITEILDLSWWLCCEKSQGAISEEWPVPPWVLHYLYPKFPFKRKVPVHYTGQAFKVQ